MRNKNIYCELNKEKKTVFFISINGINYNLFTAPFYSNEVHKRYCNGVPLENVFKKTVNYRQQYVKDNIVESIKLLETELGIALLKKTRDKQKNRKKTKIFEYAPVEYIYKEVA